MLSGADLPVMDVVWGGKLPSHGDFLWSASRSVVRIRFEEWMQLGMLQGRSQYGDAWRECLMAAPVWNFLVPARMLPEACMVAGCLAPSCDRVGRFYPFMVGYVFSQEQLQRNRPLLMELPVLLNQSGHQLHIAIRRGWPRTTLDAIWRNVLVQWRNAWPADVRPQTRHSAGSDILDVLGEQASMELSDADLATRPEVRESAYPWPDVVHSVQRPDCPSFWWTHPAGGAPLKALAYEGSLDAQLMTWLFGRTHR